MIVFKCLYLKRSPMRKTSSGTGLCLRGESNFYFSGDACLCSEFLFYYKQVLIL